MCVGVVELEVLLSSFSWRERGPSELSCDMICAEGRQGERLLRF